MPWFKKKPWEKELCSYALQEYGATGGRGWTSITEPTETPISKLKAMEFFNPGKTYRVIARYMEGDHAGQFAGVVWQHHEPSRDLTLKREEEEKSKKKEEKAPKDPAEIMDAYADRIVEDLKPIVKLQQVLADVRDIFIQPGTSAPIRQSDGEEGEFKIPPPEFDGKLPVYMHPFVVKTIFGELNAFVDHAADRFGNMFGVSEGRGKPQPKPEEEEEPMLPSIKDFASKPAVQTPTEIEVEDEEEVTLPMPQKKEDPSASPEEEDKAESVPSLFPEEGKEEEKAEMPAAAPTKEREKK